MIMSPDNLASRYITTPRRIAVEDAEYKLQSIFSIRSDDLNQFAYCRF
jgi:hypothetical protein